MATVHTNDGAAASTRGGGGIQQLPNRSATPSLQANNINSRQLNKQSQYQHRHSHTSLKGMTGSGSSPLKKGSNAHAKFLANGGKPLWDNSTSSSQAVTPYKQRLAVPSEGDGAFQKSTISAHTQVGATAQSARRPLINIKPIEDMDLINQWIGGGTTADDRLEKANQSFE